MSSAAPFGASLRSNAARAFDVEAVRAAFPILGRQVNGRPLVYLDSANSAQKPRAVIQAMVALMEGHYANVHRGSYALSHEADEAFEGARTRVARFIKAASRDEVVFTRGATEAINLVAQSWGRRHLKPGDRVVVTQLEHHANLVPWQMLRAQLGIELVIAPIEDDGAVDAARVAALLDERVKLVAIAHVSNALGTILPVAAIVAAARRVGAAVLVDGCQAAAHMPVDVQALGADFYVFSSHKLYGPTGIGVLWGRAERLAAMPPWQGGGDMIERVSFERTTFKAPPYRFEAGTPAIVEAVGLGAAIDWLDAIGLDAVAAQEEALRQHMEQALAAIPGVRLVGAGAAERGGIVSFVVDGAHAHDVATVLDTHGVAVRAGQHCAHPLMDRLGVTATARASIAVHTLPRELDALAEAVADARRLLTR